MESSHVEDVNRDEVLDAVDQSSRSIQNPRNIQNIPNIRNTENRNGNQNPNNNLRQGFINLLTEILGILVCFLTFRHNILNTALLKAHNIDDFRNRCSDYDVLHAYSLCAAEYFEWSVSDAATRIYIA